MPNYSYNTIAIGGNRQQVIKWLNKSFKKDLKISPNAKAPEIEKKLKANKNISLDSFNPMPKTFHLFDTTNPLSDNTHDWFMHRIDFEDGMFIPNEVVLDYVQYVCKIENMECPYKKANKQTVKKFTKLLRSKGTWIGKYSAKYVEELSQDSDRKQLYFSLLKARETYVGLYRNAVKEQREKYGVVGWYDWGIKYRGTKWDSYPKDWRVKELAHDKIVVYGDCETAWSVPDEWVRIQQERNDNLEFFCYGNEEDHAYNGYFHGRDIEHWIKGDDRTLYEQCKYLAVEKTGVAWKDFDDEQYDVYQEIYNTETEKIKQEFYDFVEKYLVN